jgi:nitrite reductase (NADH) large subunit
VQEVLDIYGNGQGCEVCKPALSYMLDMLWCGDHDEDRSARYINDRVHANIQKDGTFSVIPRMRWRRDHAADLRRIADVADKVPRPDGEGHRQPAHRSAGASEGGSPEGVGRLGHALRSGVYEGRPHGEDLRRAPSSAGSARRTRPGAGIEMERRFENLFTPHKVKMATVGCPGNCAEATVKDIGPHRHGRRLAGDGGRRRWQERAQGDLLITVETTEQALEASEIFFQYYREQANYLERTYDFVERLGIEKVRKETVYAPEAVRAGAARSPRKSKARSSDAWLEGQSPRTASQFIPLRALDTVDA